MSPAMTANETNTAFILKDHRRGNKRDPESDISVNQVQALQEIFMARRIWKKTYNQNFP